jgi:hypothetical protein
MHFCSVNAGNFEFPESTCGNGFNEFGRIALKLSDLCFYSDFPDGCGGYNDFVCAPRIISRAFKASLGCP